MFGAVSCADLEKFRKWLWIPPTVVVDLDSMVFQLEYEDLGDRTPQAVHFDFADDFHFIRKLLLSSQARGFYL